MGHHSEVRIDIVLLLRTRLESTLLISSGPPNHEAKKAGKEMLRRSHQVLLIPPR